MQSQVRRDYLSEPTLAHRKRTRFFLFHINGEGRETVSAVFHYLPIISKEQSLQVPKGKKDPKPKKKDKKKKTTKQNNTKPIIKPFPEIAEGFFLKCGKLQKSVSWAGRRNNTGSTRAGSATGESGGRCGHSLATHHRRCLKYCHSLRTKALTSLRHHRLRITSSSIIFQTDESLGSKISSPSQLSCGLEIY